MRTTVGWGVFRRALGLGLVLGLLTACEVNEPEDFKVADAGDDAKAAAKAAEAKAAKEEAAAKEAAEKEAAAKEAAAKKEAEAKAAAKTAEPAQAAPVKAEPAKVEPAKVAARPKPVASEPVKLPVRTAPAKVAVKPAKTEPTGGMAGTRASGGTTSRSPEPTKVEPAKTVKVEPTKAEPMKVVIEPPPTKKVAVPQDPACPAGTLEAVAATGALTDANKSCLEASFGKVSESIDRERISLVLIQDAAVRGDIDGWSKLVERHLQKVDENNASLAYKYGLHQWETKRDAAEAYRWSERALANRAAWLGAGYDDNVYKIYKLRAAATQAIWRASEEALAADPANEEALMAATRARGNTFRCAKEWLEFARATKKDTGTPLKLCTMSGEPGACGEAS